ncbi:hypothetical protein OOK41_09440 [Micromonospora sp. NBC_01655]|uniref:hypothetical protein n=1 Tax=Micromonospora sp. NBC_01655 TaxID=2975983 RepID=UPI002250F643|nr:hypothetical protein [Micromonospora sp. NBC_01655]MCX4470529.1 hypothetical protein [Micromonospora sp. NBC_01655]
MRQYSVGPPTSMLAGADVALIGLFSGRDSEFGAKLDVLAASVEAHGGRVVSRHGREVAQACRAAGVGVAVFVNPLTERQRAVLGDMFGCLVVGGDLFTPSR